MSDRYTGFDDHISQCPAFARDNPVGDFQEIPEIAEGIRVLETTRRLNLEAWMDKLKIDAVIFLTVADVAPSDADVIPASADIAWRNGTWVANGNLALRHCGVPTATVPTGLAEDIGMPAGLTFAGRGWSDNELLAYATACEATGSYRTPPPRTAALVQR